MAEVLTRRLAKIIHEELQVVGQMVRDLVLARLSNVADGFYELLIGAFDVVSVAHVDLEAHVLDGVSGPQLKLMLRNEQQR